MAILAKPSRSYADVEHDRHGLSGVGTGPRPTRLESGFKQYRPSLTETRLKRPMYDPNPASSFAPLTQSFHITPKHRKDQALAGQKAELDHILQPGFKSSAPSIVESHSTAGPSRLGAAMGIGRSAGGLSAKKGVGLGIRSSTSLSSLGRGSGGGRSSGGLGGVYLDSSGKIHDDEFDPFAGVTEMSRRKTGRRSAFGADRRKGSESGSSSGSSSGGSVKDDDGVRMGVMHGRKSFDGGAGGSVHEGRDAEEIRKKLEVDRRRLDELSGYAAVAARRRSFLSERSGRGTPSLRSTENGLGSSTSLHKDRAAGTRSRSQQGSYVPSPLSPTFGQPPSAGSYSATRVLQTTLEGHDDNEDSPRKTTERTDQPTPPPKQRTRIEDKKITITGFDAPMSSPLPTSNTSNHSHHRPETPLMSQVDSLRVPDSARQSASSRTSSEMGRDRDRPKPAERPREELFPETPAQVKRREDREKRNGRPSVTSLNGNTTPRTSLGIDTSGAQRVLPEIEIVEDDDPRIVFPEHGRTTRVQTVHDHVIRGPFSHALNAQGQAQAQLGIGHAGGVGVGVQHRRESADTSIRSITMTGAAGGSGSKPPSTILEEGEGGYLPSRWANGDKALRKTEDERERYRPQEWGGKKGDLAGRHEEWKPTIKEEMKRIGKDLATNARFSMFRTKKKLSRKAEI